MEGEATYNEKELIAIRDMAKRLYERADKLIEEKLPPVSTRGSKKNTLKEVQQKWFEKRFGNKKPTAVTIGH